jgi:hypothetical protein
MAHCEAIVIKAVRYCWIDMCPHQQSRRETQETPQSEDTMGSEVSRIRETWPWKTGPKDKHLHRNKHGHTQTHTQNMSVTVQLLCGTRGRKGE